MAHMNKALTDLSVALFEIKTANMAGGSKDFDAVLSCLSIPFKAVVSAAAKKGTSLAVEREPGVGLRSGLRWGAERGKKLTASSLKPDCPRF
ncbi:MAG: hypothetical protein ACREAC_22440 [Blastocatellia bacterium]